MDSETLSTHIPRNEVARAAAYRVAQRRKTACRAGSFFCVLILFIGLAHLLGSASFSAWADASLLRVVAVISAFVLGVFLVATLEGAVDDLRERAGELRPLTTEELEALAGLANAHAAIGDAVARWLSSGAILTVGDYRVCQAYMHAEHDRQARHDALKKLQRAA